MMAGITGLRLAVVACMDHRLDPHAALGLSPREAHVIRNAGGIVTDDVLRSLTISQHLLGTSAITLVHHTDCGMTKFDDNALLDELEAASGVRPPWTPGSFGDAETDVRVSMERIAATAYLPHREDIRGFVYDVELGELREIERRS